MDDNRDGIDEGFRARKFLPASYVQIVDAIASGDVLSLDTVA